MHDSTNEYLNKLSIDGYELVQSWDYDWVSVGSDESNEDIVTFRQCLIKFYNDINFSLRNEVVDFCFFVDFSTRSFDRIWSINVFYKDDLVCKYSVVTILDIEISIETIPIHGINFVHYIELKIQPVLATYLYKKNKHPELEKDFRFLLKLLSGN